MANFSMRGLGWMVALCAINIVVLDAALVFNSAPQTLYGGTPASTVPQGGTGWNAFASGAVPLGSGIGLPGSLRLSTSSSFTYSTSTETLLLAKEAIGTTTPVGLFHVSNRPLGTGAFATTTTTFGEIGTTTSRTCFNIKNSAGASGSFYINAANTLVIEANLCR
jgi:hypothetical protein